MADLHSIETRRYNMSRIRSKNTKPELLVRQYLFNNGFRFRIHDKRLLGQPDIVLKKFNTVIFVNGCFWHGHGHCRYATIPMSNRKYWKSKLLKNVEKDKMVQSALRRNGWKLMIIWECQLKSNKCERTLAKLAKRLKTG